MDYAALQTEILTDPAALGYAAHVSSGADSLIAGILNLPRTPTLYMMNRKLLYAWFLVNTIVSDSDKSVHYYAWEIANGATETAARRLARQTLNLLTADADEYDWSATFPQRIVTLLESNGVISAAQKTTLNGLATKSQTRAETLWGWGTTVSPEDVARALRG